MTAALSVQVIEPAEGPALVLPAEQAYVTETATGLVFSPETPIELWGALVSRLIVARQRIGFALADAINFGRDAYGERYAQWVDETGLQESTLANVAWVGRQIESSRRREGVDFTYYQAVAPLPPEKQTAFIDAAVENGWRRHQLREAIKADRESAVTAPAVPVETGCSADTCAGLTIDDLTDDARAALHRIAHDQRVLPEVAGRVFVAALIYVGALDCFVRQS